MIYTPPAGDTILLEFTPYEPPAGGAIVLEFGGLPPEDGTVDIAVAEASIVLTGAVQDGTVDASIEEAAQLLTAFDVDGDVSLRIEEAGVVQFFPPHAPSPSTATVEAADGTPLAGTLPTVAYRISRYINRVGTWSAEIPSSTMMLDGEPVARQIRTGSRVSIADGIHPYHGAGAGHLLYQGRVESRQHTIGADGTATLMLSGSLRTEALVRRSTYREYAFEGTLGAFVRALTDDLIPEGAVFHAGSEPVQMGSGKFQDLSRYQALIKGLDLARHVVREGWDRDRPEIVPYDGAPASDVVFRQLEPGEDPYQHEDGSTAVALIAGRPRVRWNGSRVVNRIIAVGSDTVANPETDGTMPADLTLDKASMDAPYAVESASTPGGTIYYLEDADSIAQYGLAEVTMRRGDMRNPNDDAASRRMAANALYMTTVNELIKHRSEVVEIALDPVANGAHVWALPGDVAWFRYRGEVLTDTGQAVWLDLERRFVIAERHDTGHESGIRQVSFVLAAPEMEFEVPGLPERINPFTGASVPAISTPRMPNIGGFDGLGDFDGLDFDGIDPWDMSECCADPTDIGSGPEDYFGGEDFGGEPGEEPPPEDMGGRGGLFHGGGGGLPQPPETNKWTSMGIFIGAATGSPITIQSNEVHVVYLRSTGQNAAPIPPITTSGAVAQLREDESAELFSPRAVYHQVWVIFPDSEAPSSSYTIHSGGGVFTAIRRTFTAEDPIIGAALNINTSSFHQWAVSPAVGTLSGTIAASVSGANEVAAGRFFNNNLTPGQNLSLEIGRLGNDEETLGFNVEAIGHYDLSSVFDLDAYLFGFDIKATLGPI